MRVVVCGATGFIGGAICRALVGRDVVRVGRGDAVPQGDILVWAAGRRLPDLASNRAIHVEGAAAAVRACRPLRAIYLSSGECYGRVPVPFCEDAAVDPMSDYARAKLEGEQAVTGVCAGTIALRLGVVYGPGQQPRMLVPQLVDALRARRRIAVTEGRQTRDFVFVDDVAAAVLAAIDAAGAPSVINVARGVETAVREVCLEVARITGAPTDLIGFGEVAMRTDEPLRYVLDVQRAARTLGWRATTTLSIGLERAARHEPT